MSGGKLPTTGIALGGTALTIGGYQVNWLVAMIVAALAAIALGALLLRGTWRRGQPAPIAGGGGPAIDTAALNGATAVVPQRLLQQHRPVARTR